MTKQCVFCGKVGTTFDIIHDQCKEAYNICTIREEDFKDVDG